ncbi:MAG TPA: response regulator transcription factor [Clostridiaceae bacterium]|nr:response regulator transcription factor [Clostridiaceae bacterium]
MRTLLCVEDEKTLLNNNCAFFARLGYRVLAAETLAEAGAFLVQEQVDAIILDIMLPDGNGLELLKGLRAAGNRIPVILLTAWGKPQDVSLGYKLGATAYISKPFDYDAVQAIVENIFERYEELPETIVRGSLTLKLSAMVALMDGKDMLLTQKEFALLLCFVQNENKVIDPDLLYTKVWNAPMKDNKQTLRKHISSVRKKLQEGGSCYTISAVRDQGYRFGRVL